MPAAPSGLDRRPTVGVVAPPDRRATAGPHVVKFTLQWRRAPAPTGTRSLVVWRNRLRRAGLVGVYSDGVGFGNVSVRVREAFVISGSGTGAVSVARASHFTRVTDFDLDENRVACEGPVPASSESLTHAAVYAAHPQTAAVAHAHHRALWEALLDRVPTTSRGVAYGTPAMAREVLRLFAQTPLAQIGVFAMGGHEEGLVAFGETPAVAAGRLLALL